MTYILDRDTFMTVLQRDGHAVASLKPGEDITETLEELKDAARELGIKGITIEAQTKAQLRVTVEKPAEPAPKKTTAKKTTAKAGKASDDESDD